MAALPGQYLQDASQLDTFIRIYLVTKIETFMKSITLKDPTRG